MAGLKAAVLALALSAHGFAPTQQGATRQVQVYGYVPSGVDPAVYVATGAEHKFPAPIINPGTSYPWARRFTRSVNERDSGAR